MSDLIPRSQLDALTPEKVERIRRVLKDIASDMENDATAFDGKPLTGRTVAEYFGNHGAAIAALANVIEALLPLALECQKCGWPMAECGCANP